MRSIQMYICTRDCKSFIAIYMMISSRHVSYSNIEPPFLYGHETLES